MRWPSLGAGSDGFDVFRAGRPACCRQVGHSIPAQRGTAIALYLLIPFMLGKQSLSGRVWGSPRSRGISLLELLVAIAVIAILLSLLLPVVSKMRNSAQQTECVSNLHQIGTLVNLYAADHNGELPSSTTPAPGGAWIWDSYGGGIIPEPLEYAGFPQGGVLTYMAGYRAGGIMSRENYEAPAAKHIFNCPSNSCDDPRFDHVGYIANQNLMVTHRDPNPVRLIQVEEPAKLILAADNNVDGPEPDLNRWYFGNSNWDTRIGFHRHNSGANCLFLDGSVRLMTREDVIPEEHISFE